MSGFEEERRYVTDDRDYGTPGPSESMVRHELAVSQGGNGDWYISVLPEGHKIGPTVRICTSGGASSTHPGLTRAVLDLWRALAPRRALAPLVCSACGKPCELRGGRSAGGPPKPIVSACCGTAAREAT